MNPTRLRHAATLFSQLHASLFAAGALFALVQIAAADEWRVASKADELTVYERQRAGTSILEYKAVGTIDAPPAAVKRVLDDVAEYPKFMPYVAEARVLRGDASGRVTYQRLAPPMVGERDYTIRVDYDTQQTKSGPSFTNRWHAANDLGPAERSGVTRVKITEGSWHLEPTDDHKTRATYLIFSDSGGSLPTFVANAASRSAIPRLFAAVRKQVQQAKYLAKE